MGRLARELKKPLGGKGEDYLDGIRKRSRLLLTLQIDLLMPRCLQLFLLFVRCCPSCGLGVAE